ncbi:MAG: LapA family protein [Cyanobacteria bacterium P01_E01_bin.6]
MAIRNLLLLILFVGSLVIFTLENMSPVVPLVILGSQTQALPLAIWLVGAIALGVLTTLLVAGLMQVATSLPRSRTSRFYADRPRYRPANAEPMRDDDEEDWQVIDVEGDRSASVRSSSSAKTAPRPSQIHNTRADEEDRSSRRSPQRSTTQQGQSSPLEDWDQFTVRRTEWNDWNAYEDAPASKKRWASGAGDRPLNNQAASSKQYQAGPETVIQDSADRDWEDWKDYRDQTFQGDDSEPYDAPRSSSPSAPDVYSFREPYPEADDYPEDRYDVPDRSQRQETRRSATSYDNEDNRYASQTYASQTIEDGRYEPDTFDRDDDAVDADRVDADHVYDSRGEPEDDDWERYGTSQDEVDYAVADDRDADYDDYEIGVDPDIPSTHDDTVEGDDGYYTSYVHYTEEDDYYDDYDDYATGSVESSSVKKTRPSDPAEGSSEPRDRTDNDDDFDDFDDWEDPEEKPKDSDDDTKSGRRIYEVPQQPAAVNRTGTLYSYRYRSSDQQQVNPAIADEAEHEESDRTDPDGSTDGRNQETTNTTEPGSDEPRILTTPPPQDFRGSDDIGDNDIQLDAPNSSA